MILPESLTKKWIDQLSAQHRNADKILIEKTIRALYLLEQLKVKGLDFIFKGGTSLILSLPEIKRLSIDIDIIVSDNPENLDELFESIIADSDFIRCEKQERKTKSKILKAHYKFFYKPVTNTRAEEEYILLDILFESNPYNEFIREIEIKNPFLNTSDEKVTVQIPTFEAILGDKLTAYAPNTTGIPYGCGKEVEIIKQLFDIGSLFDIVEDISAVRIVFDNIAKRELSYRDLNDSTDDILEDIFQTSLCLSLRGQDGKGNFNEIQTGISSIVNFIISENFHLEKAIRLASKAACLSSLLRKGETEIKRFSNPTEVSDLIISAPHNTKLNKIKKSDPEAFFYWYQALYL